VAPDCQHNISPEPPICHSTQSRSLLGQSLSQNVDQFEECSICGRSRCRRIPPPRKGGSSCPRRRVWQNTVRPELVEGRDWMRALAIALRQAQCERKRRHAPLLRQPRRRLSQNSPSLPGVPSSPTLLPHAGEGRRPRPTRCSPSRDPLSRLREAAGEGPGVRALAVNRTQLHSIGSVTIARIRRS